MIRTSTAPYEIARTAAGVCAHSGRALAVGERVMAVVVETASGSLERRDIALDAWDAGARPAERLFAAWRSTTAEPNARPRPLIDDDELMDLFDRPGDEPTEDQLAFRYLLALVLIRKRRLVYEGGRPANSKTGDAGLLLVRPKGTPAPPEGPPLIEVVDPGLSEQRAATLSDQLGSIMNLEDGPTP